MSYVVAVSARVRLLLFVLLVGAALCLKSNALPAGAPVPAGHRILVGYFPQWGLYNQQPYTVKTLVQSGAAAMLDQINYAQGFVTNGHCSVADPNADVNYTFTTETSVDGTADSPSTPLRGNFHQLLDLKRLYPRLKILISLEGRASDFAADAEPEHRAAFVSSCVDLFLKGNLGPNQSAAGLFDGIDIDWEFPHGADGENYMPLIKEFRKQMNALRPGLLLTAALGPSPQTYGNADLFQLGQLIDRAGLMTYDFNGPWSRTTGFLAPLSTPTPNDDSVERSVTAWKDAGIPADKLLIGLPFYGYGWRQVPGENHGLGQDGLPIRGDHPYREIQAMIPSNGAATKSADEAPPPPATSQATAPDLHPPAIRAASTKAPDPNSSDQDSEVFAVSVYRDPVSKSPWLFDGSSFWTYEDPTSIRSKASYAASQQLGGFMVWELSEDTSDAKLLRAAHSSLAFPNLD